MRGGGSRQPLSHFFLQAEDGIRVGHVTGVQTCALPISRCRPATHGPSWARRLPTPPSITRSEERRVGKECRRRGVRGLEKKRGLKRFGAKVGQKRPSGEIRVSGANRERGATDVGPGGLG